MISASFGTGAAKFRFSTLVVTAVACLRSLIGAAPIGISSCAAICLLIASTDRT